MLAQVTGFYVKLIPVRKMRHAKHRGCRELGISPRVVMGNMADTAKEAEAALHADGTNWLPHSQ